MNPTPPPLRLAVLVSGGGTTMQNLAEVIARGQLNAQIVCCIASNPTCRAIELAGKLNIPVEVITRKDSASMEDFSAKIADALRRHRADLALMAGYLSLWKIPDDFAGRVLNIHPALLPKFGGKGMHGEHVHAAVLAAGETESGCTVHFADNQYDHGPIILQRRVSVLPGDTVELLAARVFAAECEAYPNAVRWYAQDVLVREAHRVYFRKVLAYITREHAGRRELLVFDHVHRPDAGTQVPHGTVHVGEDMTSAVLREGTEETGLAGLKIKRKLGVFEWRNPKWNTLFERHVYELSAPDTTPETWDWHETDGGKRKPQDEFLFRFRWVPLAENIPLAAGQDQYLHQLIASGDGR